MQDDPKRVWQDQSVENAAMALTLLRQKARALRARNRRDRFASAAIALLVVAISGSAFVRAGNPWLWLLFASAIAWAVAGQYMLHRGVGSATRPGDAGLSTGLAFYRQELKQQSYLFHRMLRWSGGPLILCVAALILLLTGIAWNRSLSGQQVLPFTTVFLIWILAFFVTRSRRQRELQRELDELSDTSPSL